MSLTSTVTAVAAATSSTVLFSATSGVGNGNRMVFNDSAAILYLKYGTSAATNSYTVQIPAGGFYEFPRPCYDGVVHGIWSSATGSAYCTEVG